tara:strand:+ start:1933 stop:2199 length:267 start_codon:yes stop_codon:yes gene_type:complete
MITKFLSSKHNMYGLTVACYVIIGTIFSQHLTIPQMALGMFVVIVSNIIWYTLGMGDGIVKSEMRKGNWKDLLTQIKDLQKDNKKRKK